MSWCESALCVVTTTLTIAHLLALVLGEMGLELEVGLELAGAELALVGAVDDHHLFAAQWLLCLRLARRVSVQQGLSPDSGLGVG